MVVGRVRIQAEAVGIGVVAITDAGPDITGFVGEGALALVGFAFPYRGNGIAIGSVDNRCCFLIQVSGFRRVVDHLISCAIDAAIDVVAHQFPGTVARVEYAGHAGRILTYCKGHVRSVVVRRYALTQRHRHTGQRLYVGRNVPVVIQFRIDFQKGLPSTEVHHVAITIDSRTIIRACRVTGLCVDIITDIQFLRHIDRYRGVQRDGVPVADHRIGYRLVDHHVGGAGTDPYPDTVVALGFRREECNLGH